jgi:hypothetical protein
MSKRPPLKCKDCENWYGAEDDEIGPCTIKNMRGDKRYMTFGMHDCDEGLVARPGHTSTAELYELKKKAKKSKG